MSERELINGRLLSVPKRVAKVAKGVRLESKFEETEKEKHGGDTQKSETGHIAESALLEIEAGTS